MIGSLRGRLIDRSSTGEVLVEVSGVGYRVTMTPGGAVAAGALGHDVFLWVHDHIRDDAHLLFGFVTKEERVTFEALIGAHGVGPALALAILSVHPPMALHHLLANDDLDGLCLVPGVGKKTAARLLVELKSRLDLPDLASAALVAAGGAASGEQSPSSAVLADVREALSELGYTSEEIREATRELDVDTGGDGDGAVDVAGALRLALRRVAVGARA